VSKPEQVAAAMQAVDGRFGRIDVLINNAGVAVFKPILQTSYAEWRYVLDTKARLAPGRLCFTSPSACPR